MELGYRRMKNVICCFASFYMYLFEWVDIHIFSSLFGTFVCIGVLVNARLKNEQMPHKMIPQDIL